MIYHDFTRKIQERQAFFEGAYPLRYVTEENAYDFAVVSRKKSTERRNITFLYYNTLFLKKQGFSLIFPDFLRKEQIRNMILVQCGVYHQAIVYLLFQQIRDNHVLFIAKIKFVPAQRK